MNIYPAVDILNGKAVRLKQGRADDVTVYGQPMEMAQRWFNAGAQWLHVVDLDGAFGGAPANHNIIAQIARALPKLRIQVGGGIRSMSVIENLFAAGVQRAVLGTSAVNDPQFTTEALKRYGDRIAIGIDARDGIARVSGWTETSQIGAVDLARKLEQEGARLVIYTDIARDGVLVGPNTDSVKLMIDGTSLNVIASGGVSKLEDVRTLTAIRHPRLDGVIIGKALYEKLLTLEEALEVSAC